MYGNYSGLKEGCLSTQMSSPIRNSNRKSYSCVRTSVRTELLLDFLKAGLYPLSHYYKGIIFGSRGEN